MYCETFNDKQYIVISDCCESILNYDSALVIQNNAIECLQPFGITFRSLSTWTFKNIEVLRSNGHYIFKVEIKLTAVNGRHYGTIIYFNDGIHFYLAIDFLHEHYVYDSTDKYLTKSKYKNYTDFINHVEKAYNIIFSAKEV